MRGQEAGRYAPTGRATFERMPQNFMKSSPMTTGLFLACMVMVKTATLVVSAKAEKTV